MPRYAAIEGGGTKFRVAVAEDSRVVAATTIPTTTPGQTFGACAQFVTEVGPVVAAGVACFGPLDLDPQSPTFGVIGRTVKPGWTGAPVLQTIRDALGVPTAIDLDVAGAALAEWTSGAAFGLSTFVYMTVGTGIGGGLWINGALHRGQGNTELGHIAVARVDGDQYPGHCPFHGACLEGMAAGPAISERWGVPGEELTDRVEVWELEATYLAQAIRSICYTVAPQRFVIGGGVMLQPGLLHAVSKNLPDELKGYSLPADLRNYVVAPQHGQDAGLIGAIELARRAGDSDTPA